MCVCTFSPHGNFLQATGNPIKCNARLSEVLIQTQGVNESLCASAK